MPKALTRKSAKARTKKSASTQAPDTFSWDYFGPEGELAVDVAQTKKDLVIVAAIAGVRVEDIHISIDHDVLTVRGARNSDQKFSAEDYFYQECYWGAFSRSIILPVEVHKEKAKAKMKDGILTITIPKTKTTTAISIEVVDE